MLHAKAVFIACLYLVASVLAKGLPFESHRAPVSFRKLSAPPSPDHRITLRIGLKQERFPELEDALLQISDPVHPRYGAHLSADDVKEYSAPSPAAVQAVKSWLSRNHLQAQWSDAKDWAVVPDVPVSVAEQLLGAKYAFYQHEEGGEPLLRTEAVSLPSDVHPHVDMIHPTTAFNRPRSFHVIGQAHQLSSDDEEPFTPPSSAPNCTSLYITTNLCLRQYYGTANYSPQATYKPASIGTTGYLNNSFHEADLQAFLQKQRPDLSNFTVEYQAVNGGVSPQNAGDLLEGSLDVETVAGFTAPLPNVFYSVGGMPPFNADKSTPNNTNEPYLDWVDYMLSLPNDTIPSVLSTSYGDSEQTVPLSYATRVCNSFAQLTSQGVSIIFSSGDYGVGPNGTCVSNGNQSKPTFLPQFPATCPWVTTVGGTEGFEPEVAASVEYAGFFSGGGFSNYFATPSYQLDDVHNYTTRLGQQNAGLFNPQGRGIPDVAAQGNNYAISLFGFPYTASGTSASAPTFASIIALLNNYQLARGHPTLGFLNPWLYAQGRQGLKDIVNGSSAGCDTGGFPATAGWDAVTGLGTPFFANLQRVLP